MHRAVNAILIGGVAATAIHAGARAEDGPAVVASIKPVHSLVAAIMDGVGEPALLVGGGGSPHTYALRPSDAAALQDADAVFWIGEELETFLEGPLESLPQHATVVELAEAPGLTLLPSREGGVWEAHVHGEHGHDEEHADDEHEHEHDDDHAEDEHEHEHDHDHGHGRGETDMHVWLDPANAIAMAHAIAGTLTQVDPDHAEQYHANENSLVARLEALDLQLADDLAPVAGHPYIVFHDAYQYLEAVYGLTPAGSITISPDRQPGAERLTAIRDKIRDTGALCVFSEPQFEPRLVATVVEGTDARTATLDPLGAEIADGPELYFTLMEHLAGALSACVLGAS